MLAALALVAGARGASGAEPAGAPLGQQVYNRHCAVCHGLNGSGAGAAAPLFTARPRDFRSGIYKFRSTGSGQLPTDDDIAGSVRRGLSGSGMVSQDQLDDRQIAAVAAYIKSFSPRFRERGAPKPLALPQQVAREQAPLERGRQVYLESGCPECHGESARGDGPSAAKLSLPPSDLTDRPLKGGSTAADVVRTVLTGLDGTPMPSYHLVIDDDDVWALAYWVESVGGPPRMKSEERLGWSIEERDPPPGRYGPRASVRR
jgi:cytochrome c oxidase cbb3-type subunit 2